jgi:hypothetical protein
MRDVAGLVAIKKPAGGTRARRGLCAIVRDEYDGDRDAEPPGACVKADAEKWWPIIKELGIKAE